MAWPILVMIAVYIVIRVIIAIRRRSGAQKPIEPHADRSQVMIRFVCLILLILILALLYFAPNRVGRVANPSPAPGPSPAAQPAAKP
ncbi:MAG TPA: hypothetical protein VII43_06305 [Opitutaceae bacterium]